MKIHNLKFKLLTNISRSNLYVNNKNLNKIYQLIKTSQLGKNWKKQWLSIKPTKNYKKS